MEKATVESEGRQLAEEEVRQLYDAHQQLQDENRSYAITLDYFRSSVLKCFQGLDMLGVPPVRMGNRTYEGAMALGIGNRKVLPVSPIQI
jgi:hypothetical protein